MSLEFKDKPYHQYLVNGERVPSVTTILKVISKGDGLTQWAVNQSLEYLQDRFQGELTTEEVSQALLDSKYAHRYKKEEAAGIGTIAHNWLEQYLKGNPPELLPDNEAAANSVRAALDWFKQHDYQTISSERRLYSRRHNYAGTCDWLAYVDGHLSIPDFKTSKGIWDEYRFQTAAYQNALEEETGDRIEERWILRFDKETGTFEDLKMPRSEYRKDLKAFLGALAIFKRQKELK